MHRKKNMESVNPEKNAAMRYNNWIFKIDDGRTIIARYSDAEIEEMKKNYPEVNWVD